MAGVLQLRPREGASVDTIAIRALFRKLGPEDAEATIVSGMTDLTDQMRRIDHLVGQGDLSVIAPLARRAQTTAQDLGFVSLTTILGSLAAVCLTPDPSALAAIWDRAKRIGDKSFVDLWELPLLQM